MCLCPKHQNVLSQWHCNSEKLDLPLFVLQRRKLSHRGRGGLTQVYLAAGKGGVGIPDTDGSDPCRLGLSVSCSARHQAGTRHVYSASGWERPEPSPPCSEWSFNRVSHGSLPKESLLGMWGKQGSIGAATPPSGASGLAGQRETSKVRSLASWPSGAEQEPGCVKWGHGPS